MTEHTTIRVRDMGDRGIWLAQFPAPSGTERLLVVDSEGHQLGAVVVPHDKLLSARRHLRRLLDLLDPPPPPMKLLG